MADFDFLQPFINKRVHFRFSRQELRFDLSQSLFSSFDIDVGSRLLLKTVAKELDLSTVTSVFDMGCGVGVLGLSVKKVNPQAALVLQDRNALAVAVATHNARLNKLRDVTVQGGLAFQGLDGRRFDLILANMPGKAGEPVLRAMLAQMTAHLSAAGTAAVVVVQPLAEMVAATLQEQACDILYQEAGQGYTVFHFRGEGETTVDDETAVSLAPYWRNQNTFTVGKKTFTLQTAYNLPEFDNPGYYTSLAVSLLKNERIKGRVFFWNPGQGHLPVYLRLTAGKAITSFTLAGRDALSLQVSAHNLAAYGTSAAQISVCHSPDFQQTTGEFDWLCLFPDADAGVSWSQTLLAHANALLAPQGNGLITAKSTSIYRMLENEYPLIKRQDRKKQGYRALILQRAS